MKLPSIQEYPWPTIEAQALLEEVERLKEARTGPGTPSARLENIGQFAETLPGYKEYDSSVTCEQFVVDTVKQLQAEVSRQAKRYDELEAKHFKALNRVNRLEKIIRYLQPECSCNAGGLCNCTWDNEECKWVFPG